MLLHRRQYISGGKDSTTLLEILTRMEFDITAIFIDEGIKGLKEMPEKEVALFSMLKGLSTCLDECPYQISFRSGIRDFINHLETKKSRYKILNTKRIPEGLSLYQQPPITRIKKM